MLEPQTPPPRSHNLVCFGSILGNKIQEAPPSPTDLCCRFSQTAFWSYEEAVKLNNAEQQCHCCSSGPAVSDFSLFSSSEL